MSRRLNVHVAFLVGATLVITPRVMAQTDESLNAVTDAGTPDAEPHPVLAIFSPDWMPIVTLGYQFQHLDWSEAESVDEPTLHGLSASLLLPVLATGTPDSRVRLAFGVGVGVDLARHTTERAYAPRSEYDPTETERPRTTRRRRADQVAAQLGLILRAAPAGRGFLGSLVWMPGVRRTRLSYEGGYHAWPVDAQRVRSMRRARVTFGYVHDHLYAAFFLGASRWEADGAFFTYLVHVERVFEFGLQVGAGW